MRFMPAALAVAETGIVVLLAPEIQAAAHEAHAVLARLPDAAARDADQDDQHDLAARETAAHAFAMPDQPFHQPQQPPGDQHERPVLRQQVEDREPRGAGSATGTRRRWRAATAVRKMSVSYRSLLVGEVDSVRHRPAAARWRRIRPWRAAAANTCSARSCPAAADTRTPAADTAVRGGGGGGAGSMPRLSRLNRPNTISSTGQVLSKLYGVKLFSANSTPTVISVMGPRMARSRDGSRSRSLIAHLPAPPCRGP